MKKLYTVFCSVLFAFPSFAQSVNFAPTDSCLGKQISLIGYFNPDSTITSWKWDFDNDGQFDDWFSKDAVYSYSVTGTQTVRLMATTNNGYSDSISKPVSVHPVPVVNFQADNLCALKPAIYVSQSTIVPGSISEFKWDFNNDGIDDKTGTSTASYTCGPAQAYQTKLTCISDKGCSASAVKSTTVFEQPEAKFSVTNYCLRDTAVIQNQSTVSNDIISISIWKFGDGIESTFAGNASHIYSTAGTYSITLVTITPNFCRDTISKSVSVFSNPGVAISLTGDTSLYEGESATLKAEGNVTSFLWSTGGTTSAVSVSSSGNYSIKGTDNNGCEARDTFDVTIKKINSVVQPGNDLLTPNNDGFNDKFIIADLDAYSTCNITVYNVWGDPVYSSSGGYKNDWDGNYNGKPLPGGSYYYTLKCDDKPQSVGNLNILR